jgi:hypothetical protein
VNSGDGNVHDQKLKTTNGAPPLFAPLDFQEYAGSISVGRELLPTVFERDARVYAGAIECGLIRALSFANLHLDRPRDRTYLGLVVLVHAGLERSCAYRVLCTQTITQCQAVTGGYRIEIEDRLCSGQIEFLEAATFATCVPGPVIVKIFAEQIEAWRNAQVNHHHIGGLRQVAPDGRNSCGDIALRQPGAVVAHVNRKRLAGDTRCPGHEILAGHLIRPCERMHSLPVKRNPRPPWQRRWSRWNRLLGDSDFRVLEVLLHKGPLPVNTIGPIVDLTPGSISSGIPALA